MLTNEAVEAHLKQLDAVASVQVTGDGYHYHLSIVSDEFVGKSKVARQQWVYSQLRDYITSGSLHALTMQTWTNAEWEEHHG